ncbi:COMPASS (complex proteins associated with Set1p) component [Malassezia brasiliensis]|uniref:COMPASS (Complex proteins associated with Set1p) component n=1 Tax=Malassezia brasiliensis TaxID=1821822 RepID=A0AAF0DQV1_9BASI|nr:COMPASS (complex proteins associated with Set1p) component [Malassezia brasiliensis]
MRTVRNRVLALDKGPNVAAQLTTDAVRSAHHPRGYAVWTRPSLAQGASTQESAHTWFARMQDGIRTLAPIAGPPPGTSVGVYARAHATPLDGKREYVQWAAELARVRAESACGNALLDVLAVRGKLLQLAEDRLSTLPPATEEDVGKHRDASIPRCGFDARLVWDDEPLWAWATSPTGRAMLQEEAPLDGRFSGQQGGTGPEVVCGEPKRRCKRHADWSIVRGADIEVARELQTLHMSSLAEREQTLRAWLDTPM